MARKRWNPMEDEGTFSEYDRYIDNCVRAVQTEMATGSINTEESLLQLIRRTSEFLVQEEAFAFFNTISSSEWKDHVNEVLLTRFDYDLGALVLWVINTVVVDDVFSWVSSSAGYDFLMGKGKNGSKSLKDGSRLVLKEHWGVNAVAYDRLIPTETIQMEDQTLSIYQESETDTPVYVLTHPDPALVWMGSKTVERPTCSAFEYHEKRCEVLREYGCPEECLWLTAVQTIEEFTEFCGFDPDAVRDLHEFFYVIFYHEDGEPFIKIGFNSEEEFERGCEEIAGYLKG